MPYDIPLLILPLLGGFVFLRKWYHTRWHTKRAEKDRLLFQASLAGLGCLAPAFVISSIPPFIPCLWSWLCLPLWWEWLHLPFSHAGTAVLAFLIGALGWIPLNYIENKWYQGRAKEVEAARIIRDYGGPLEQTLYRSIEQKKLVMLTLKNGKVYIGKIVETFIPDDKIIYIFPSRSGYRDSSTQTLELTTSYDEAYRTIAQREPTKYLEILSDFRVAIPVDYLVSASLYLPEIHQEYFGRKSPLEL